MFVELNESYEYVIDEPDRFAAIQFWTPCVTFLSGKPRTLPALAGLLMMFDQQFALSEFVLLHASAPATSPPMGRFGSSGFVADGDGDAESDGDGDAESDGDGDAESDGLSVEVVDELEDGDGSSDGSGASEGLSEGLSVDVAVLEPDDDADAESLEDDDDAEGLAAAVFFAGDNALPKYAETELLSLYNDKSVASSARATDAKEMKQLITNANRSDHTPIRRFIGVRGEASSRVESDIIRFLSRAAAGRSLLDTLLTHRAPSLGGT